MANAEGGQLARERAPLLVRRGGESLTQLTPRCVDPKLAAELADNTSAATAVEAGFLLESLNYTLTDDYLTHLFSTTK